MIRTYLSLIPRHFRSRLRWIAASGILRRALDLLGLATLLPLMILMVSPDSLKQANILGRLFQMSGLDTIDNFSILLGAFTLIFLPLKSLLTMWFSNLQYNALLDLYRYYSFRIFTRYHNRGLLYLRSKHSTELSHHINGACYGFSTGIVAILINSLSEIVMLAILAIGVIISAPQASLLLILCLIPIILIYLLFVKKKLQRYGKESYDAKREQAKLVQESLRGFVSMELNNGFGDVLQRFGHGMDIIASTGMKSAILGRIPSALMEVAVASCLLLLLGIGTNSDSSQLLFILFGFAALRILPSTLSLMSNWGTLKNSRYVADIIEEVMNDPDCETLMTETYTDQSVTPIPFNKTLKANNLCFSFGDEKPLIYRFNLTIHKGEFIGIQGISGGGKSTLFNLLLGFYAPTSGNISIDGVHLQNDNRRNWHRIVGYVEQDVFMTNDSLAHNIALSAQTIDRSRITTVLNQVGLSEWIATLPQGIDTPSGEGGCRMSGGQRQRIAIARALYKKPSVLFLDEATSALDRTTEEEILELLHRLNQSQGLTMLFIAHRDQSLNHCDRIIRI